MVLYRLYPSERLYRRFPGETTRVHRACDAVKSILAWPALLGWQLPSWQVIIGCYLWSVHERTLYSYTN